MSFVTRYIPKTTEQFGLSQPVMVALNFMQGWVEGSPFAKAILLHGRPGCGKTTLVQILAKEHEMELVQTNASMDHGKANFNRLLDNVKSGNILGTHTLFFFDEIDNLSTRDQTNLLKLIGESQNPVMLACNRIDEVDKRLRAACITMELPAPSQERLLGMARAVAEREDIPPEVATRAAKTSRSYRQLLNALESRCANDEVNKDGSLQERIMDRLRGQKSEIRSSEMWAVGLWIHDNSTGRAGAEWDLWLARSRKVGRAMNKYAFKTLDSVMVPRPEWPWSLGIRPPEKEKEEEEKYETPVGVEGYF